MESTQRQKSVYVVEDDMEMSTIIDRVIKSIDPQITLDWSTSAEEAIKKIHTAAKRGIDKPYDLIVADILLDGSSTGVDLWRYCKKTYENIPVVLTSATPKNSLIIPEKDLPEFPIFLQKPFSIIECRALFRKLLIESRLVQNNDTSP